VGDTYAAHKCTWEIWTSNYWSICQLVNKLVVHLPDSCKSCPLSLCCLLILGIAIYIKRCWLKQDHLGLLNPCFKRQKQQCPLPQQTWTSNQMNLIWTETSIPLNLRRIPPTHPNFRTTCSRKPKTNFPNDIFPHNIFLYPSKFLMTFCFFSHLLLISNFYLINSKFRIYALIWRNKFCSFPIFTVKPTELCRCIFLSSHKMTKICFTLKWQWWKFLLYSPMWWTPLGMRPHINTINTGCWETRHRRRGEATGEEGCSTRTSTASSPSPMAEDIPLSRITIRLHGISLRD